MFIIASVRTPQATAEILTRDLKDPSPQVRVNSILKIQVLWKSRYQIWPRLEENGQINMKVTPSQIEFTLPSPKIGIENLPVVDPPWMPKLKTKVENLDIRRRGHVSDEVEKDREKLRMFIPDNHLCDAVQEEAADRACEECPVRREGQEEEGEGEPADHLAPRGDAGRPGAQPLQRRPGRPGRGQ